MPLPSSPILLAEPKIDLQSAMPVGRSKRVGGFTLIELMITVVIAAILVSLAVPSFTAMIQNNRLTAQANGFKAALQYARATALAKNTSIQVCPVGSPNSTTCGSLWSAGWMVVMPGTTLLQVNRLSAKDATLGSSVTTVNFSARGFVSAQSAFTICDSRGASVAKAIQVETTGSIQIAPLPGKTLGGAAITCP